MFHLKLYRAILQVLPRRIVLPRGLLFSWGPISNMNKQFFDLKNEGSSRNHNFKGFFGF